MATKKKAAKKGKANKKAAPKAERKAKSRIARQKTFPGMEDRAIKAIEELALDYCDLRDERQRVGADEVRVKTRLLELMHKEKKSEYHRGKVHITIKPEGEKITVRIKDEASPDEAIEIPDTDQPEVDMPDEIEEVAS